MQDLLDESGIGRQFDAGRGKYAERFADELKRLGDKASEVSGTATLPAGGKATVSGRFGADGAGVVAVKMAGAAEFFCRAECKARKDGSVEAKLVHLLSGRPMRVNSTLVVSAG